MTTMVVEAYGARLVETERAVAYCAQRLRIISGKTTRDYDNPIVLQILLRRAKNER